MGEVRDGTVRVGVSDPAVSLYLLPPIRRTFSRVYPGIAMVVAEGSDQEVEQWLREGEIDIAFVRLPNREFNTYTLPTDDIPVVHASDVESPAVSAAPEPAGAASTGVEVAGVERAGAGAAPTSSGRQIGLALNGRDEGSPACRAFLRAALVTDYGSAGS